MPEPWPAGIGFDYTNYFVHCAARNFPGRNRVVGSDRSERQTSGRDACIRALQAVMAAHPLTARRTTSAQTAALVSAASLAGVLVGLIGRGIQQSRTPMMHEREAARLGLDCAYILVDFDALRLPDAALPDILAAGAALGFQGFNVTHPFKQQILPHLDALSPKRPPSAR